MVKPGDSSSDACAPVSLVNLDAVKEIVCISTENC